VNYNKIIIEKKDNYAVIFLNNKERRNALDFEMSEQLVDISNKLSTDESVRAIVITGSNGIFCAGADIREFIKGLDKSPAQHFKDMDINVNVFKFAQIMKKPVIASVEGFALGGGFGLVAASHIAVAGRNVKFGMPELNLGIFPYCIFPYVKKAIGERLAVKLALTREIFDETYAKEIGLIHYIENEPLNKACDIASSIATKSPLVLKLAMEAINKPKSASLEDDYLALLRIINFGASDLKEGAEAFLEKRKPEWTGN
jgi:methylglutaconyl-CoA hydratase